MGGRLLNTLPASVTNIGPVTQAERIASLDVLRGFAVLGMWADQHLPKTIPTKDSNEKDSAGEPDSPDRPTASEPTPST